MAIGSALHAEVHIFAWELKKWITFPPTSLDWGTQNLTALDIRLLRETSHIFIEIIGPMLSGHFRPVFQVEAFFTGPLSLLGNVQTPSTDPTPQHPTQPPKPIYNPLCSPAPNLRTSDEKNNRTDAASRDCLAPLLEEPIMSYNSSFLLDLLSDDQLFETQETTDTCTDPLIDTGENCSPNFLLAPPLLSNKITSLLSPNPTVQSGAPQKIPSTAQPTDAQRSQINPQENPPRGNC